MLGQQQQQQPAGSLFGSMTQGPTSTGTSLFGSTTTQQQPSAGGLFGTTQNPSTSTGTGLFGSTQPQQSTNIFSPTATGTQGLGTGGSLFGSTNPQQQQQQQQQQQLQQGSLFGNSTLTAGTLGTSLALSQLNSDPGAQCAVLTQRIEGIKNAWDATSPQCKFQAGDLFP